MVWSSRGKGPLSPTTDDCDENEEECDYEDHVYFNGLCSCEHEREEHGWGSCDVTDCPCEGGWEE
jgi:hypothetical protein